MWLGMPLPPGKRGGNEVQHVEVVSAQTGVDRVGVKTSTHTEHPTPPPTHTH